MNCLQDIPHEWVGPLLILVLGYPWWSDILSILVTSVLDGDSLELFSPSDLECVAGGYDTLQSVEASPVADGTDLIELLFNGLEF